MAAEKIRLIPLVFTGFVCFGIYLIFLSGEEHGLSKYMSRDGEAAEMLRRCTNKITARQYTLGLLVACGTIFAYSLVKTMQVSDPSFVLLGIIAAVYLFWMLRPCEYVFGNVKSIFSRVLLLFTSAKRKRMDRDLYAVCVVLKNISRATRYSPLSADRMLEKLAKCASKDLKPVILTSLSLYRTAREKEAFEYFARTIGTPAARSVAGLLSKLDSINPALLTEQTEALIESMNESRITAGYRQAQKNGLITIALATFSVMIAMLDFLVVVVYMDLMTMLAEVW